MTPGRAGTHSGISPLALPISGVLHWCPATAALSQTISYKRVVNYLHRVRESAHLLLLLREPFPQFCFPSILLPSSKHLLLLSRSRCRGVTMPRAEETNV